MESRGRVCEHLHNLETNTLRAYKILYRVFVVSASKGDKILKNKYKRCHSCRTIGPYLHACLHCVFFGCQMHTRQHAVTDNHNFTVELIFGQVHCNKCGDYIYDEKFDSAALELKLGASTCRKRLFNWTFFENAELMTYNAKRICITPESTIGLRGLLNLGHTCFMNCIVQSFMHMPLLREYFLTEHHKCTRPSNNCLVCELSKLFQDFYKGSSTPLSLHKLLHLIWTHAKHLGGYEQQDAHEFFIAMLDVLHEHGNGSILPSVESGNKKRPSTSIIDQIFTGKLQSDVVCKKCKGVSTKIEPMKDIGLDLGPVSNGRIPLDIQECLERYTRAEDLGEDEKIMCSKCNSNQESTKQVTMKTLPIVASFYLKRVLSNFEEAGKKISTKISFPETLDMSPFMSKVRDKPIGTDNKYSLFAVINHVGNFKGGHYTAYVRQQRDYWYKCNDHIITRANLEEVLDSEAYILFYHKNILLYD